MRMASAAALFVFGLCLALGKALSVPLAKTRHQSLPGPRSTDRFRRIINGSPVEHHEFSYRVAIEIPLDNPTIAESCGGSLIDESHVLTAAHCFHGKSASRIERTTIYLNALRMSHKEPDVIIRRISNYVIHPNYRGGNQQWYDIAILTLDQPVIGIPFAQLPQDNAPSYDGKLATVIGWGITSPNGKATDHLLKTTMRIIDNQKCAARIGTQTFDWDLCYESPFGPGQDGLANDNCAGDSGGPIIVDGIQVGIVSHRLAQFQCGDPNAVDVNTRVSFHLDWIRQNSSCCGGSNNNNITGRRSSSTLKIHRPAASSILRRNGKWKTAMWGASRNIFL